MKRLITALLSILILGAITFVGARWEKLYQVQLKGGVSGAPYTITVTIDSVASQADLWLLGDTTLAGAYTPENSIELRDIKMFADAMASGDSFTVKLWALNEDDTTTEVILVPSDTAVSTAGNYWLLDQTMGSTTKTIKQFTQTLTTGEERLAVEYNWIAGTPGKVTMVLEVYSRFNDAFE